MNRDSQGISVLKVLAWALAGVILASLVVWLLLIKTDNGVRPWKEYLTDPAVASCVCLFLVWLFVGASAGAVWVQEDILVWRSSRRESIAYKAFPPRCERCGYDVRASPLLCLECGVLTGDKCDCGWPIDISIAQCPHCGKHLLEPAKWCQAMRMPPRPNARASVITSQTPPTPAAPRERVVPHQHPGQSASSPDRGAGTSFPAGRRWSGAAR